MVVIMPHRSELLKFFGLTYAMSWVLWTLVALIPPGTPLRAAMFLPGTFAPALVALWLAPRPQELIDRVLQWRVPGRWYLFALGYLAAVKLAAAIVYRIVAGFWPTLEPGPWLLFVGGILVSTPFQAGEEIGWRGYALPRRPVVLTFDDGYREDFTNVRPLLARRHWPGVLNLAVRNLLDRKLSTPQIRLMIRQGWEIDAHTINHLDLTTLGSSDLRHEVAGSRTWIRRRFHVPVDFFCYPSGRYNSRVLAAVHAAGFFGATIEGFGAASPRDGLLTLPRIRVGGSDGVSGLAAKLDAYR